MERWGITAPILGVLFILAAAAPVSGAENFPSKPLELIVPYAAGGSTDVMARTLTARAAPFLNNQPVVVVNKTGAATVMASRYVLDAKPDGYTLYSISNSSMMITPALMKANYSWRDFTGIAQTMIGSSALYVKADSPLNTLEKFFNYAKENPGKIKYTTPGAGSQEHLALEGLAAMKGLVIKHIPTKGDAEAITALLGGHVQCAGGSPIGYAAQVTAGTIICLAQFGTERDKVVLPNAPTLKELGVDLAIDLWRWIAVHKNTPPDRVRILAAGFRNILH
ncbi:MAG TPA: tripartite tricarboxylate transporter substrate binding protein, partial [Thermodesulfobacteriota bacterium]|nr:tripartite tricarboxylate transporter substrate binding protein [Thermodesulfobacteriota bacterium]